MKNLIIYFSVFGSTKRFAEMIRQTVGGDIVEIKPVRPYEREYKPLLAFSKKEVDEGILTEFVDPNININDYENVFVGYPMWWYTYPPIIKHFFKKVRYDRQDRNSFQYTRRERRRRNVQRDRPRLAGFQSLKRFGDTRR